VRRLGGQQGQAAVSASPPFETLARWLRKGVYCPRQDRAEQVIKLARCLSRSLYYGRREKKRRLPRVTYEQVDDRLSFPSSRILPNWPALFVHRHADFGGSDLTLGHTSVC
jgi:hypothetical protein